MEERTNPEESRQGYLIIGENQLQSEPRNSPYAVSWSVVEDTLES